MQEVHVLSQFQEWFWRNEQLWGHLVLDNMSSTYRILGPLDVEALERALVAVLESNEILRSLYVDFLGTPLRSPVRLETSPLERVTPTEGLRETISAVVHRRFDLTSEIPFRAALLTVGPEEHVLVLVVHHISFDAASWALLLGDISHCYQNSEPASRRLPYSDSVEPPRERQEALDWWAQHLANLPPRLRLSPDRTPFTRQSLECAFQSVSLPSSTVQTLRSFARRHDATVFEVMLAAFKALLLAYNHQNDLAVCITYAGRTLPGSLDVIGLFANLLPVRTRLDNDPTFLECLARVRSACLRSYSAPELAYDVLVEHLRATGGYPLDPFAVPLSMVFTWNPPSALTLPGLRVEPIPKERRSTLADLNLAISEGAPTGLKLTVEYAVELFEREAIVRFLADYQALLERVMQDPLRRLSAPPPRETELPRLRGEAHTLGELIERAARTIPDAPAILAPGRAPLTYRDLQAQAGRVGDELRQLGLRSGDRLATLFPDQGPVAAVTTLLLAVHITVVPLRPGLRPTELQRYLQAVGIRALLASDGAADEVARDLGVGLLRVDADLRISVVRPLSSAPAGPAEIAFVLQTSGTTARPKVVPLSHRNLCAAARTICDTFQLRTSDRCLNVMPLYHIHGFSALLATLTAGGSFVCWPSFYAPAFFDVLEEWQPTWYTAAPAIHRSLLDRAAAHAEQIRKHPLRFIRSASGQLPVAWLAEMERAWGAPVVEVYGMTETASQVTSNALPPGLRKPGTVGRPTGAEVAIRDADPSGVGEVVVRGESLFGGYEGERPTFVDGWFRTGDLGSFDDDGYLTIIGRCKDIINRGGEKVWPWEVDDALRSHPAVAQAVSFPIPDDRLGEEVAAVVVLRTPADEPELQAHVAGQLSDFKVPRRILVVDEIPATLTGKISRSAVAQTFAGKLTAMPATLEATTAPSFEQEVTEIWKSVLGVTAVGRRDNFFALGGDSLIAMRLIAAYFDAFGVTVPIYQIFGEASTVAGSCALIGQHRNSGRRQLGVRVVIEASKG